jgi:hypothetical protein
MHGRGWEGGFDGGGRNGGVPVNLEGRHGGCSVTSSLNPGLGRGWLPWLG